jgi:hypothetical protein
MYYNSCNDGILISTYKKKVCSKFCYYLLKNIYKLFSKPREWITGLCARRTKESNNYRI